jgi:sugar lactone lactonase YvrE
MSWSPDNKTIYVTDSPSRKIMAYPYDLETGAIALDQGKVFFECPFEGCVPDGHVRDENDNFWIAFFGSHKVLQVNQQGEVLTEITLPARCVTCPTICGTELFVTSAQEQDPEKYPDSAKNQGSVFKVDIGVRGRPLNKFRLNASV